MSMTNQETDTALILENELKRRVTEVLGGVVYKVVKDQMETAFKEQKAHMMMEISIAVGKMLRVVEEEGRNPLWETDMTKLGFGPVPTQHNIEKVERDAVHQKSPPVQTRVPDAAKARRSRRAPGATTSA